MKHVTLCSTLFAITCCVLTTAAPAADTTPHAVPFVADPLPLSAVRLTGGPLQTAQQLDAKYLLQLEPDKMLYWLRIRAGLTSPATGGYGGWDAGATRQLTGHIAGHYLSAISYMYAATGNPEFKRRVDYMVDQLAEVQDAQKDGYIGALMANGPRGGGRRAGGGTNAAAGGTNTAARAAGGGRRGGAQAVVDGKARFEDLTNGLDHISSGGFDLNGMWSPWYVEHKIFAGLRDAYHYTGNHKALEVEIKFAGWVDSITSKLNDAEDQKMLRTEFGGMNEVLADLYHDTGDAHWLAVSDKFEDRSTVTPLSNDDDILGRKHGNTLLAKMMGELARYIDSDNTVDGKASEFFWDQVVFHHSYATGGHGHNEYFDPPDQLAQDVEGRDDESCNVYNMLKMTRDLFALKPDDKYAEFMERALFNHVLGSIDPNNGNMCYMVPVGQAVTHEYQNMFSDFTCCVGTGMENHALHGYGIYYQAADQPGTKLWVNLFTPNTAEWKEAGAKIDMATTFPEGETASLKLTLDAPKELTLEIRRPLWAGDGFTVAVNGSPVSDLPKPGSYVEIKRNWKSGDTVALNLPQQLHEEPLPDNKTMVAILRGPIVLAGDLGPERRGRGGRGGQSNGVPVLVSAGMPMNEWIKPDPDKPGDYKTVGVGKSTDVELVPFYKAAERTYAIYWDTFTKEGWEKNSPEYAAEQARVGRLKAATVGFVQPGQMQAERDANFMASSAEESTPEQMEGHYGRRGAKWFSFDIAVDPAHPMTLVCTFYNEPRERTFDVLVDGAKVGDEDLKTQLDPKFFDAEFKIPAGLVEGKTKVTVRFEATKGNEIGTVYGLRTIRADMNAN